jgi:hypothetical protein
MALVKNETKVIRTLVCSYKGYSIYKEVIKHFRRYGVRINEELYDNKDVTMENTYYGVSTKHGGFKRVSDRYAYCCYSEDEAKSLIDRIEGGKIVLTEKERHDWVTKPNSDNDWGFNTEMLLAIMRAYKKASPRRRLGYLERLEDANFHTEYGLLEEENYEKFEKVVREL